MTVSIFRHCDHDHDGARIFPLSSDQEQRGSLRSIDFRMAIFIRAEALSDVRFFLCCLRLIGHAILLPSAFLNMTAGVKNAGLWLLLAILMFFCMRKMKVCNANEERQTFALFSHAKTSPNVALAT